MSFAEKIKLKICGMRQPENILDVTALHPDYVGFIFFTKSPRDVGNEFEMPVEFPADIKRVGVFVNETTEVMLKQVKRLKLDYLQLHGSECAAQCEALRKQGIGVIKVFSVDDDFDFALTGPYKRVVDFFLFDTKGKFHGGNAQTFNWDVLKAYDQEVPFFLSGGLNPENVKELRKVAGMNIHALDVNSGVETSAGVKDIVKVNKIIKLLNSKILFP
jgi:phosphoribosylanthranilate isomerase